MLRPISDQSKRNLVEGAVASSGHNTQLKVETILRDNKWEVFPNPYFPDRATKKQREIDILAKKTIRIQSNFTDNSYVSLEIIVPIECRYLAAPVVFGRVDIPQVDIERIESNQVSDPKILSSVTSKYVGMVFFNKQQAAQGGSDLFEQINKVTSVVEQLENQSSDAQYRYIFPMIVVDGDVLYTFDMQETESGVFYINFQVTNENADDSQREYLIDIVTAESLDDRLRGIIANIQNVRSKIERKITFEDRDRAAKRVSTRNPYE